MNNFVLLWFIRVRMDCCLHLAPRWTQLLLIKLRLYIYCNHTNVTIARDYDQVHICTVYSVRFRSFKWEQYEQIESTPSLKIVNTNIWNHSGKQNSSLLSRSFLRLLSLFINVSEMQLTLLTWLKNTVSNW